ncbi:MAG: LysR family transcriptional regulator [Gammaproteobacteria bacterium]|nr:LysR family transcriptional regulator [Gammaproteobacteria bacterium]
MLDYASLSAIAAVVREGSFERAARALNVTPSAVSQRVKQLEERLGSVLIVRGQPCTATETGRLLCSHVEQVGMLEHELRGALPKLTQANAASGRVTLRVAVNADSLGTWFIGAMAEFLATEAALLDVALDDQEHTVEWLKSGEVLAAVTAHAQPVQGCNSIALGRLNYAAVASPAFMQRYFPEGVTAASLANAPGLTFNRKDRLQSQWIRKICRRDVDIPTHWFPSTQAFIDASVAGIGWGMNPASLVKEHLRAGTLVELVHGRTLSVPLYWQHTRLQVPMLGRLTYAVLSAARGALRP